MSPLGDWSGENLMAGDGAGNQMRPVDGIKLVPCPAQGLFDRVLLDAQDMDNVPIGLSGGRKLDALGLAEREFCYLLIGKRPEHCFKMIVGNLADDLQLGDLCRRQIRLYPASQRDPAGYAFEGVHGKHHAMGQTVIAHRIDGTTPGPGGMGARFGPFERSLRPHGAEDNRIVKDSAPAAPCSLEFL